MMNDLPAWGKEVFGETVETLRVHLRRPHGRRHAPQRGMKTTSQENRHAG